MGNSPDVKAHPAGAHSYHTFTLHKSVSRRRHEQRRSEPFDDHGIVTGTGSHRGRNEQASLNRQAEYTGGMP